MYLFVSNYVDAKKTMAMMISTRVVNTDKSLLIFTKKKKMVDESWLNYRGNGALRTMNLKANGDVL